MDRTRKRINGKFCGKVAMNHISTRPFPFRFFFFFKISDFFNFLILTIFVNMGPYEKKILNHYSCHSYDCCSTKPFLSKSNPCDSSLKKLLLGILKKKKFSKKVDFFLIWDPMGGKFSKRYSYSFDSFSSNLFLNIPFDSPPKLCL